ncbi:phage tail protein [Hymenobacter psychrophilus]|uniref:Microcystin-dependent protein n=1 Tax=Hymenobacter psychrophilus TaxID=651662 RepID=A0A1H3I0F0_9BACT|nr:tail fiber protein [Hymenobacter psychrophilus]SDY20589.1 Microcystin-dependent protein [Hymenobacter psychrophilus]
MADFSSSASGSAAGRRSLLQRFQRWLRPGAVARPQALVSMRPNGGQPYVGEIAIFAGNFPPSGWMFCDGSLLPISENETLFQLIGTTYGGDGQESFALPDLRGRAPLHQGNNGTSSYTLAQQGGVESVTLTVAQIPAHTHTPAASTAPGTSASPIGTVPADSGSGSAQYTQATTNLVTQPAQTLGPVGGNQPHDNMQPYLAVNYIISLFGIFPSPT